MTLGFARLFEVGLFASILHHRGTKLIGCEEKSWDLL
jgi:hypothetical protein